MLWLRSCLDETIEVFSIDKSRLRLDRSVWTLFVIANLNLMASERLGELLLSELIVDAAISGEEELCELLFGCRREDS